VSTEGQPAATCTGVVKIYWTPTGEVNALKGIDASFPAGRVTAVVGPSGSGKSSLLRLLAMIDRPTAGRVQVGDRDVSSLTPAKRRRLRRRLVGYVFQRPADNLVSYLSAAEHVALSARLRGGATKAQADELLEVLGLAPRAKHLPAQLSGGEQQRLALACAIVGDPPLVVADEPTAELDSRSGRVLMETIGLLKARGVGFVVSTHDPIAVEAADRTLYLRHGALEAESHEDRALSVIDASGRIQLPPRALRLFPDRRAVIHLGETDIRITPP
jgi:ABC-type lipoprotein export system ATPase subunit